jgi:hypothetical protein
VPAIRMRVIVIVAASALGVAGCHSGGTVAAHLRPSGGSVPVPPKEASAPPSTSSTLTVPTEGADQYAGLSPADWGSIDQAISDAQSDLAQSDADASHNEQGDTTP